MWLLRTGRLSRWHAPSDELTLYGNVDVRQVELGFRVAGRLQAMNLEEGQAVRAGMVLASLDLRPFEDELRLAEADVAVEDATAKKIVAGNRPAEIARARAAVDEAVASQVNARTSIRACSEALRVECHLSSVARRRAGGEPDGGCALGFRYGGPSSARSRMAREDIAAGKASLQAAEARLATAQTALDDARLVAPSDGIVISRVREPGAIVSPNDVVYVLSLTKSVWVRAYVAEPQLGRLRLGMERFRDHGHLAAAWRSGAHGIISPTAEFTPKSVETPELRTELVYRLRIIVDEPFAGLQQGMPVTVRIHTEGSGP